MNLAQFIREWPQWRTAGAEAILDSPAFCMPYVYKGSQCSLRPLDGSPDDTLDLAVKFEGVPSTLSLADSTEFPDLHLLWSQRSKLPQTLLLALVEKECGAFLQSLENATQLQLSISGLASADAPRTQQRSFTLGVVSFSLEFTPQLNIAFGKFSHLDFSHESIRSMTRKAIAEYAVLPMTAADCENLEPDDLLLLPDDFMQDAAWRTDLADDNAPRLCSVAETGISFGEFADGKLPDIPAPAQMHLILKGKTIAEGVLSSIGERKCFKLTRSL